MSADRFRCEGPPRRSYPVVGVMRYNPLVDSPEQDGLPEAVVSTRVSPRSSPRCRGTFALHHISCCEHHGVLAKLVAYLPIGACAFREGVSASILRMISVFRRHLVGSEAGVERRNFFLCLDLGLAASNVLGGDDRFGSSNVRLHGGADTKEQVERYQRRLRRRRYPYAMAKDHRKAVHRPLSSGYIGLQLRTTQRPFANGSLKVTALWRINTMNVGTVLYDQLSFFLR
jgi:hypothetical protein